MTISNPTFPKMTRQSHVHQWPAHPKARIEQFGIEPGLDEVTAEFQPQLRKFATDVMRPIGQNLDKLSAADIIAPGSEYWTYHQRFAELGISLADLATMEPAQRANLLSVIFEELGYGDGGLAISTGAGILAPYISMLFGNQFLMERFPETELGCWGITEPDHGSDSLDPQGMIRHPGAKYGRANTVARFYNDRIVLNGQKAAWVSNGTTATHCILYCAADFGDGPKVEQGCVLVIPLDLPGITRGKPLEKLGQRANPQGELFFEDVEVPLDYVLAGPEDYMRAVYCVHTEANAIMGSVWTGAARAAYDLAHAYAHERKQGGVPIYNHQLVSFKIFDMFRKVEASTALSRRVTLYNATRELPALQAAMSIKTLATQTAFDVASMAINIFGGNGLTDEYPVEKMMRDARASMIEDGCNDVLSLKGGYYLMNPDLL